LWKVADDATKDLMVDYYRTCSGRGPLRALREVQKAMIANQSRWHPYYWAAFVPIGNWHRCPRRSGAHTFEGETAIPTWRTHGGIFVSYRQADAKAWAISLRDDLAEVFGADQVFLDKDTLHAGNWRAQIQRALDRCKVMLVVIGPRWLTIADEHNRPRIHLADDVHHQEIALALSRSDVTVIPVLVDEASMPSAEQLPQALRTLCDQQARKIGDTHARRQADLEVLVKDIEAVGGLMVAARPDAQDRPTLTPEHTRGSGSI
jgi:hypothetical protein